MTKIAHLTHRALIRLRGPDWAAFLKGLCTAHIERLGTEVQQGRFERLHYGAFLRPQGKMIGDVLLHAAGTDDIRMDVPERVRDELVTKLNMYKLRAKVTIEAMATPVFAAFDGEVPDRFMADPRGAITGASFGMHYGTATVGSNAEDWAAWRYEHGIAESGSDFGPDQLYAIDANLDLLDAIDFKKGCYVGQELTSRMKRRGQIKTRVLPLRHEGQMVIGEEILSGERRAGEILASTHNVSLGLMRLDRIDGGLSCGGRVVHLHLPAWLAPAAFISSPANAPQ